mmetsp:Transcript_4329/g.10910  ORF Transcript_4329/g.10910 Transcript_4329/m.10910 type:complete len:218 (-) Transcript_4329:379-1032(-)
MSSSSSSSSMTFFSSFFSTVAAAPAAGAAATGLAAAYASGSSRNFLTGSTSLKVNSTSATSAATFLKALPNMCGRPASVGMPTSRLKAAMFATPAMNFPTRTSGLMSSTAAEKTEPSWKTCATSMPYSKGLTLSLLRSTAALGDTFSPTFRMGNSDTNSIWPLTILVPMFNAWKKEVWDGSMPVGPEGKFMSTIETWPLLAAAGLRCFLRTSRMSSS